MKDLFIKYDNKNKNETTERRVLVTEEIKDTKAARVCLDVTDMSPDEIHELRELHAAYKEAYYANIPSFEEFVKETHEGDTDALPTIKWRRFLSENTEVIVEST